LSTSTPRGQIELHKASTGLRCRIDNVEKALVGAHLDLLAALLVDMRRTIDGELFDRVGQRIGPRTCRRSVSPCYDSHASGIENSMVERLETNANILAVHRRFVFSVPSWPGFVRPIHV